MKILEATAILTCFEKFLKSRFIVIAKFAITFYISRQKSEEKKSLSRPAPISGWCT